MIKVVKLKSKAAGMTKKEKKKSKEEIQIEKEFRRDSLTKITKLKGAASIMVKKSKEKEGTSMSGLSMKRRKSSIHYDTGVEDLMNSIYKM